MKFFVKVKGERYAERPWAKFAIDPSKGGLAGLAQDKAKATEFKSREEAFNAIRARDKRYSDDKEFEVVGDSSEDDLSNELIELGLIEVKSAS